MLTRLFDFWKVKAWLDGHVEVTNPNESIDTVYPADKTSFVPRCPKLYSLIVGDMVTLARGAQPIFSPHISVTIALSVVSYYGNWCEPAAPCVHVSPVWAPERNWEPGERDDDSSRAPVVTASHPALVSGHQAAPQYLQSSPLFSFFSELFTKVLIKFIWE